MDKKELGSLGEKLALEYLINNGHEIVAINFKIGRKELDIIARKSRKTIFFEVKTRTNNYLETADLALKHSQLQTLKRAINYYCLNHKIKSDNIRLDLIAVNFDKNKNSASIKHYKNIF